MDNELSWFDWENPDYYLLEFVRRLTGLRRAHPVFRRRRWFKGRAIRGVGLGDIAWFRPDGSPMSNDDWQSGFARSFAVFLNGDALMDFDADGKPLRDESFLLLFNAHHEPLQFAAPDAMFGTGWSAVLDTAQDLGEPAAHDPLQPGSTVTIADRAIVILRRT